MTTEARCPITGVIVLAEHTETSTDPVALSAMIDNVIGRYSNGRYPNICRELIAYRDGLVARHEVKGAVPE